MIPSLHLRLVFDTLAAALLLFGFSYWWLGNVAHELAGTAMFLMLIAHNVFNRRWYGAIPRARRQPRGRIDILATGALLAAMLVLLITSVLISNALSGIMSQLGGFTVRQIHTLAAYWALVLVAIHLGLRWPLIMGAARNLFGIQRTNPWRTAALRLIAAGIAIHGVWSSSVLGLGDKLAMRMTLEWWNFEESSLGFFIHCGAIAGLYIFLTYYAMKVFLHARRGSRS